MEDLRKSKRERSKAKQLITVTSRQLNRCIQRKGDMSKIESFYNDLEKQYTDFIVLDDEYKDIVNSDEQNNAYKIMDNMDLDKYTEHVGDLYNEAVEAYNTHLDRQEADQVGQAAVPVRHMIMTYMEKCERTLKRISDDLCLEVQSASLKYDCSEMEKAVVQMNELMGKLMTIQTSDQYSSLYHSVTELSVQIEEMRRAVFLKTNQETLPSPAPLQPLKDNVYVSGASGDSSDLHVSNHTASRTNDCYDDVKHIEPAIAGININTASTCVIQRPDSVSTFSTAAQLNSSTTASQLNSSASLPLVAHNVYPTSCLTRPIMSTAAKASLYNPDVSLAMNPSVYVNNPPLSHSITSYYTGNCGASSVVGHTQSHLHGLSSVQSQVPLMRHHFPGHNMENYGSGMMHAPMGNTYARLPINAKVEKIALPKFSGKRRDWAEFKAVWMKLAEGSISDPFVLATELKRAVKGTVAENRIKSVSVTRPEAYDFMWKKLNAYYDNAGAIVSEALEALSLLQPVQEKDYQGLIHLVDEVESCFSQLGDIGGLNHMSVLEVDKINDLLPTHIRAQWVEKFRDLPADGQLYPFLYFMSFLERHRDTVIRLAERDSFRDDKSTSQSFHGQSGVNDKKSTSNSSKRKFFDCAVHCREGLKHTTSECSEFKKLEYKKKLEALRNINACFRCFGDHMRQQCQSKTACAKCGRNNHHYLLCNNDKDDNDDTESACGETHKVRAVGFSLYAIMEACIAGTNKTATVFCDDGSDTSYITHSAAQKLKAKSIGKYTLDVTSMGDVQTTYKTKQYEISIRTQSGKIRKVVAFGMDKITGPVSNLDENVLRSLFPNYDVALLQRKSTSVDLLLGSNYFGLHPKFEIMSAGDNLSVMQGELGVCLQGTHPELFEKTLIDSNMVKLLHDVHIQSRSHCANVQGNYHKVEGSSPVHQEHSSDGIRMKTKKKNKWRKT